MKGYIKGIIEDFILEKMEEYPEDKGWKNAHKEFCENVIEE